MNIKEFIELTKINVSEKEYTEEIEPIYMANDDISKAEFCRLYLANKAYEALKEIVPIKEKVNKTFKELVKLEVDHENLMQQLEEKEKYYKDFVSKLVD